ncbi:unnamed protein product [Phaedon cochleariae]|uniref:BOD1/SHG1 domain-containing protein n=1 Tax=Phaedon cochleariae TaxID=80249 RepID=A0A9P0GUL9_PHACE|nr:unnamed protein product [Phaedon cochleariae]
MEVMGNTYMPGDPRLVEQLVYELKSQGIFDQLRRECIADVDTKPAYQNLRQRVEGSVTSFLKQQTWRPDMIKNQLREQLRKNIHESGYLETGVERIVEQVVNPKINTVILPQVEDVSYKFLGIEKPFRDSTKTELNVGISELLPKDLEAVSPDSVHSFKSDEKMREIENFNDSLNSNSKADDDESPPFELLIETKSLPPEDNSVDSHLSGFSGLQSHESNHCSDIKIIQVDLSNPNSQVSQNDSDSRLSIIIPEEVTKMDVCEDSFTHYQKSEASEGKSDILDVDKVEGTNNACSNDKSMNNDVSDDTKGENENSNHCNEEKIMAGMKKDDKMIATDEKSDKSKDAKSSKSSDKHVYKDKRDDKYKSSSSKDKNKSSSKDNITSSRDKSKKDSRSSSSSIKEKDKKEKYKEKSNKSDKHAKEKSSKDKEKSSKDKEKTKDTYDKIKGEKNKEKSDKDRDRSGKDKEKDKSDRSHDKEKSNKEKKKSDNDENKSDKVSSDIEKHKEKEKDQEKSKEVGKSKSKEKSGKDRDKVDLEGSKVKGEIDEGKSSKSDERREENKKSEKSSSSKEKEKTRDKERPLKEKSTSEIESPEKDKSKKEKDIDRDKSKSSSSKSKNSSNSKKESSSAHKSRSSNSSTKDKPKTDETNKSKSLEDKNTTDGKHSRSKKEGDRKRDSKKQSKDDHYSSKEKKSDRRSTDRDSNDGQSSRNNSTNSFPETSSSLMENNDNEFSSSSGPVESGNSDEVESTPEPPKNEETITNKVPPLKLTKPKFASNFQEARKLMKIRKELAKLERQNQLNSFQAENVDGDSTASKVQDSSEISHQTELPSESVKEDPPIAMSMQPLKLKLTKPKFASNFQEARKLMKIRKQLAKLERQNQLRISYDVERQDTSNEAPVDTGNSVEQVELSSEPAVGTNTIKPLKLNKPKFASNFQEARKLMKIRKQLAKLERQNQQNISARIVLDAPSSTSSGDLKNADKGNSGLVQIAKQPLKLNKPKFASNFREATKLMKIRKRLSKLEQENELGFTEVQGSTENAMYKADKRHSTEQNEDDTTIVNKNNGKTSTTGQADINSEIPDSSINEPLKSTELSQENWEALEARLAQEMSNVNYNCYDEFDDLGSSTTHLSPKKSKEINMNLDKSTSKNIEDNSENSQNDSIEFKGFELKEFERNPTDFFKSYFDGGISQNLESCGFTGSEMVKTPVKTNEDPPKQLTKLNNNFKQLSVILDVNDIKNINKVNEEIETQYSINECRYLEQQSSRDERNLQYIHKFIEKLEKEIEDCKTELQNNVHYGRGQKRKFEEFIDQKNNNKSYFEQTTVKKRGRPPGSNSANTKAVKMCNTSDILQNNSFPLPLSPAESDKSNDKKEEEIVVPAKRKRIGIRASQRYSSEDLYKPRLVICRRSRGAKNTS